MVVGITYNVDMTDTLAKRIRFARQAAGLSQQAVADHFGISRVSVTQWEGDRDIAPEREKVPRLAVLLRTTVEWLLENKGEPPQAAAAPSRRLQSAAEDRSTDPFRTKLIPGRELVSGDKMPIYAGAAATQEDGQGHIIVTFDPVDYVKRPAALENVRNGYGIIVMTESMIPAYRPGDTALVNPNLPPMRDSDVVLYHLPPDGVNEAEALVKQLNGWNDRNWHLEQFNPPKPFDMSRADWPVCHRIVGRYNRR